MVEIDRGYLLVALALAVAGMLLGLYMGLAADNKLQTVHVAMVLPGFVTLAIYGFIFRLWPALKAAPLAAAQFWTGTIGAVAIVTWQFWRYAK